MQYFVLFFAILILDQVSKEMIHLNMSLGESNAVLDDIFHITYIRNTGAAFSILNQHTVFLGVFAGIMVVTILVFVFLKRKKVHFMMLTALIMIAAGGTGNVIDRLMRGYVIDFFDFRIFPVFNIADIFVTVGCVFLVVYVLFLDRKKA